PPAMARPVHTVCAIAAAFAALGVSPAAAQFNPFEAIFGTPPRPPSSVPTGRQPAPQPQAYPQYPDQQQRYDPRYPEPQQQYPDQQQQPYPGQVRQGPPGGGIQSQPLPPPPGGTTAAVPGAA